MFIRNHSQEHSWHRKLKIWKRTKCLIPTAWTSKSGCKVKYISMRSNELHIHAYHGDISKILWVKEMIAQEDVNYSVVNRWFRTVRIKVIKPGWQTVHLDSVPLCLAHNPGLSLHLIEESFSAVVCLSFYLSVCLRKKSSGQVKSWQWYKSADNSSLKSRWAVGNSTIDT